MLDRPLVFLDLETTGATAWADRITEIGLVEVDRGRYVGEWSSLVNPQRRIPPAIQALTGINDAMVADAPTFEELAPDLFRRLSDKVLVAHNARFDYGFLRNEFRRLGFDYSPRVLCTVKLSRRLYPQERRHNLDSLIERHNLACDNRHRALADARVLWDFTQHIHHEHASTAIRQVVDELLQTPSLPAGLAPDAMKGMPDTSGVYIFYGENDSVLYVGKSVNLRTRVMSHFSGDHSISKDMHISRDIRRIEWIETAGEFSALIKEAQLVKRLAPLHNRRLRESKDSCTYHWNPADGPKVPILLNFAEIEPHQLGHIYGTFRSKRAARNALRSIADEYGLCLIGLGLEKGSGACFAHQLRKCRGACVGRESELNHAMRVSMALSKIRITPWPFKNRILVRERNPVTGLTESHMIDHWRYLGTYRSQMDLFDRYDTRHEASFDVDTYKLLVSALRKPSRHLEIIDTP
ncbi:MAG: exonuclease domain-containing protein [Burkholderiales bacterium]|jgi:DNA polymerase-3 subunit epsilon